MSIIKQLLLAAVTVVSTATMGQGSIAEREYWLDGDATSRKPLTESVATVDISSLINGLHSITMRVKDDTGLWSTPMTQYFIIAAGEQTTGKDIVKREYWIDGDATGKKTLGESVATVDISSLINGLHSITMRVKDDTGLWSTPMTQYFIIAAGEQTTGKDIVEREYWIDGDATGKKTLGESVATVDISSLINGLHSITMRVKDDAGLWSTPMTQYFIIAASEQTTGKDIVEREYWIDGDATGKKTLAESVATVDISSLINGLHSITMRVKDDTGLWSTPMTQYFIIAAGEQTTGKDIVEREYWIDGDATGKKTLAESVATVDISSLHVGLHSLTIRVKDDTGVWSSPMTQYFVIPGDESEDISIVKYLYWIDDDTDNLVTGPLSANSGVIPVDISEVEAGEHTLSWCVGDSRNVWSEPLTETFISTSYFVYIVPKSGIGSFSADLALKLPEGLTAHYTAETTKTSTGYAVRVRDVNRDVIPANVGVLLKGTGGESYKLRMTDEEAPVLNDNTLVAVVESVHIPSTSGQYTNMMLKDGEFIKIKEEDETFKMPANRAYLPVLSSLLSASAKSIVLLWSDGTVTGIHTTSQGEKAKQEGPAYNLNGQRVKGSYKGVVIINGKKVLKK